MSRQSDLEKQMRADRERIVGGIQDCHDTIDRLAIELEVLDRHLGGPTDASSGFDSVVTSPQSQPAPAPHRTRKARKKTMVENDPPAVLKWHCADCKKDVEVETNMVKGVAVTTCTVCGGPQVERLE